MTKYFFLNLAILGAVCGVMQIAEAQHGDLKSLKSKNKAIDDALGRSLKAPAKAPKNQQPNHEEIDAINAAVCGDKNVLLKMQAEVEKAYPGRGQSLKCVGGKIDVKNLSVFESKHGESVVFFQLDHETPSPMRGRTQDSDDSSIEETHRIDIEFFPRVVFKGKVEREYRKGAIPAISPPAKVNFRFVGAEPLNE